MAPLSPGDRLESNLDAIFRAHPRRGRARIALAALMVGSVAAGLLLWPRQPARLMPAAARAPEGASLPPPRPAPLPTTETTVDAAAVPTVRPAPPPRERASALAFVAPPNVRGADRTKARRHIAASEYAPTKKVEAQAEPAPTVIAAQTVHPPASVVPSVAPPRPAEGSDTATAPSPTADPSPVRTKASRQESLDLIRALRRQ